MNDTQSMARQRGGGGGAGAAGGPNPNYGSQRQGNPSGPGGFNNNINQFNGPPPNNYNSYGDGGNAGNNYPIGGGGVKRED